MRVAFLLGVAAMSVTSPAIAADDQPIKALWIAIL